jgi:hypothetical protein
MSGELWVGGIHSASLQQKEAAGTAEAKTHSVEFSPNPSCSESGVPNRSTTTTIIMIIAKGI